jgi:electron transport complex protein RnfB
MRISATDIDALLPQTQCTRCGFQGCMPYAEALAAGEADINRCPPGGEPVIINLSRLLNKPVQTLDPACGVHGPRRVALIDEANCIGCTLCIQACPVDAIVGASKQMHVVLTKWCTGCDLCIPPCPVDCISMIDVTENKTGWNAWSQDLADISRQRYHDREQRLDREQKDNDEHLAKKAVAKLIAVNADKPTSDEQLKEQERKRAIIAAAIARAQQKK